MLNMDSQWHPVRGAIEAALIETLELKPAQLSRYAIKSRKLYGRARAKSGTDKAIKLLKRLAAIPRQHLVPIFAVAVNDAGLREAFSPLRPSMTPLVKGVDPFKIAFEQVMARVDAYVHTSFSEQQVLWIHDVGSLDKHAKDSLRGFRLLRKTQEEDFQNEQGAEFDEAGNSI
jgi:hypothetical protein